MMIRTLAIFLCGLATGAVAVGLAQSQRGGVTAPVTVPLRHPLQVRLHRVMIRDDALARYGDWQRFLHDRHADAVATLAREHMYVEAMFRDVERDPHVLYWLEVQGRRGREVE